jgi:hypothetical protein
MRKGHRYGNAVVHICRFREYDAKKQYGNEESSRSSAATPPVSTWVDMFCGFRHKGATELQEWSGVGWNCCSGVREILALKGSRTKHRR